MDAVFSPDGTRILTRDILDLTIRVWDLKGNKLVNLQVDVRPSQATWSPDGTSILVCEGSERIDSWP